MTWYVLKYSDGKYVAVDYASGGYPYATDDPNAIKFWRSEEEARTYPLSNRFEVATIEIT